MTERLGILSHSRSAGDDPHQSVDALKSGHSNEVSHAKNAFDDGQSACFVKNASVFSLNAATFSYSGACEQSSKMYSSEPLMPYLS